MAGIYVHFPFCSSFCVYCDFYSVLEKKKVEKYIDSLCEEIERRKGFFENQRCSSDQIINTIYLGGGTPSLLPIPLLERVFLRIKEVFNVYNTIDEFTIEVNPDDITLDYALGLRKLGVNRVSMGVQSFNDASLRWMNRRHSSSEAVEAFRILRNAGFENISLDLIFGYTEDDSVLERDVYKLIELSPEHISAYQMGVEPETFLYKMQEDGRYKEPTSEICAAQYSYIQKRLSEGGYEQYEISNFSKEGFKAKHNSSYWERKSYLGLGTAAHSFIANKRSWNVSDIDTYIKGEAIIEFEELTTEDIISEIIMVGLRTVDGFNLGDLPLHSSIVEIERNIEKLLEKGLLIRDTVTSQIRIPLESLFISDYIIGSVVAEK